MNSAFLNNLTDSEFLKQINPTTELERMLAERLESPQEDSAQLRDLKEEVRDLERERDTIADEREDAQDSLAALKDYAKKLHDALSEKDSDNELLDCDDAELLRA